MCPDYIFSRRKEGIIPLILLIAEQHLEGEISSTLKATGKHAPHHILGSLHKNSCELSPLFG